MDELSRRHLSSLCHRQREGGGRKKRGGHGRIREREGGGAKGNRGLLKFLSGCYCPRRVFKAGRGSAQENGTRHANCDFAFIVRET